MPIYKRCFRCGARLPAGTRCECVKQRHKEYDRYSRDRKSRAFYNSSAWEHARSAALEADEGLDVYLYMTEGIVVLADTVHHIIPLQDEWEKRNDISNLMSLSGETHSMIEQMYKKDKDGMEKKLHEMLQKYRSMVRGGAV